MIVTIADFISIIASLPIDGVNYQYDYKPSDIETADLPASFPRLPDASSNADTLASCLPPLVGHTGISRTADLAIVIEPTNQEQSRELWYRVVTMADNLEKAILENEIMDFVNYTITTGAITMNNVEYAAVVATIEGTK